MNCMKCGREIPDQGVFCEDCLLDMEKYPVKPGTVVMLPPRQSTVRKLAVKRRAPTAEEQVKILRGRVKKLLIALLVAIVLIAILAVPTVIHLTEGTRYRPGQNYSTFTEPTESTEETEDSFLDFLESLTS